MRLAREAMAFGHQQVQRVLDAGSCCSNRGSALEGTPRGRNDHCDVRLVGEQELEALLGVRLDDAHLPRRARLADVRGDRRQQRRRRCREPAQAQLRRPRRRRGRDLGPDPLPSCVQLLGVGEQDCARPASAGCRRPSCTTSSTPRSFASVRSCWETADGV